MSGIHLSATSVLAMKANPEKFFLRYISGLMPIEDTSQQRVGTNWHELHEIYNDLVKAGHPDPYMGVMDHLNEAYAEAPLGTTGTEWAVERMILAVSFTAYLHYWQGFSTTRTIVTEIGFDLPLVDPRNNLPLRGFRRVGKIDNIQGRDDQKRLLVLDYKSTSKDLSSGSDYWSHLRLDTQISMYVTAVEDLLKEGLIPGVDNSWYVGGAMLDVWKKPGIRPKKITQKETRELLDTGIYFGTQFTVAQQNGIWVDGEQADVHEGKKDIAINETPGMYGARLAADMAENPTKYFVRREVPRTTADKQKFRKQLFSIARVIQFMRDNDCWYFNESDNRYPCKYMKLIENGYEAASGEIPDGFTRRSR